MARGAWPAPSEPCSGGVTAVRQLHTVHLVCPGSAGSAGAWEVAAALGPGAVMRSQSATIAARSSGLVTETRNGVAYQRVAPMNATGVPSMESMVVIPPARRQAPRT